MTEQEFQLCRPFDLEAATAGDLVCWNDGDKLKLVARYSMYEEDTPYAEYVFMWVTGECEGTAANYEQDDVRMAPLTFIQGKPIYKGEYLKYTGSMNAGRSTIIRVTGYNPHVSDESGLIGTIVQARDDWDNVGDETWAPFNSWELVDFDETPEPTAKFHAWIDDGELRHFLPSSDADCREFGMVRFKEMDIK